MRVVFTPSRAEGTVAAPPSKTAAHRLLIAAALGTEPVTVGPLSKSEDILATLDCVRALGASVTLDGGHAVITPHGETADVFPCRESGSTLRFFLPLALLRERESRFTGSPRLMERPLGVYEDLCREQGLLLERTDGGIRIRGPLKTGEFRIRGDVSSQFVTGLLFALPTLSGSSTLRITPPVVSLPYIDVTAGILDRAGIRYERRTEEDGSLVFRVPGDQVYRLRDGTVEGDYSNAAFPDAFNLTGGSVTVTGLSPHSAQGDAVYREDYRKLAAGPCTIDLSDTPDLGPVLMALGGVLHGVTLTGTARLRIKESDRGAAMAAELGKFGIRTAVGEDRIEVFPAVPVKPDSAIESWNDHRVAMAASILLAMTGGELCGAEAVNKSWPEFYDVLRSLGIGVEMREI
ncbi:MAG: 3-phosphoshikimate 1-carboxyvinyltransferase [Clostridia bacterium]|nr:3-phosphoshikimate 1-carboxyvinyltransferase [Clostridia bacterium]